MQKSIVLLIIAILALSLVLNGGAFAKSKDSKAKNAIIKAIGKAVEGKYSKIDLDSISKINDSKSIVVYNTTKAGPIIQPPPPVCNRNWHVENGVCVPDVTPPTPTGETTTVCMAGDLSGSSVPSAMKDCNLKVGLGDLGYSSTLAYFKALGFDECDIGNHEATEDGTPTIYKEALAYCRDHWYIRVANGTTLIIGLNTNGDQAEQLSFVKTTLADLPGLKNVIITSHKAGHVPPNSHHPAEAKTLYSQIEQLTPTNVKLIEIVGHNHVMSAAPSMNWFQAGGGGRSHYSCGTDTGINPIWTFCDNTHFGYLKVTIDNKNGNIATGFYDTNNKKLN